MPLLIAHYPQLDELFRRFASPPIRNAGTLGGNIANGSPIGDSMAALMVAGCTLVLESADGKRETTLEDFYIDYQVKDLRPGEFVATVHIPKAGRRFHIAQPQAVEALRSRYFGRLYSLPAQT